MAIRFGAFGWHLHLFRKCRRARQTCLHLIILGSLRKHHVEPGILQGFYGWRWLLVACYTAWSIRTRLSYHGHHLRLQILVDSSGAEVSFGFKQYTLILWFELGTICSRNERQAERWGTQTIWQLFDWRNEPLSNITKDARRLISAGMA